MAGSTGNEGHRFHKTPSGPFMAPLQKGIQLLLQPLRLDIYSPIRQVSYQTGEAQVLCLVNGAPAEADALNPS